MSIDNFMNSVSRKKIGIKALLLDQVTAIKSIDDFACTIIFRVMYRINFLYFLWYHTLTYCFFLTRRVSYQALMDCR
uniref:Uncharacterized protein n=1 Tax=Hordeum vulgare subsp. vulgare TaxID=112509 RepID=A0A8I6YUT8_HORVV